MALGRFIVDGIVEDGLDQATAEGLFVDEVGDKMTGLLSLEPPTTGSPVLESQLAAETNPRLEIKGAGQIGWGTGSSTPDVIMQRFNVMGLPGISLSGGFIVNRLQTLGASLFADSVDVAVSAGPSTPAFRSKNTSDAQNQYEMKVSGRMEWGDGTAARDTTLERVAANTLRLGLGDQIQVRQDPVLDDDLARKKYIDDQVSGANHVSKLGDMMQGDLAFDTFKATFAHTVLTSHILEAKLAADAALRFVIQPDGTHRWGSGLGGFDVSMQRGINLTQLGLILNGSLSTQAFKANGQMEKSGSADFDILGGRLDMEPLNSVNQIFRSKLNADANDRFSIDAAGDMEWGDGTLAPDVRLSRSGPKLLKLDASLALEPVTAGDVVIRSKLSVDTFNRVEIHNDGEIRFGNGNSPPDTNLRRNGSNALQTDDNFNALLKISCGGGFEQNGSGPALTQGSSSTPTTKFIGVQTNPDTDDRFEIDASGKISWGSGSGAADTVLERIAANRIRLGAGDHLQVQQDPSFDDDVVRKKYVDDELAAIETTNTQQYITANGTTAVSASARTVVVNQTVPGAATVQLPAAPAAGRRLDITKRSATGGGNNVTVDGNGKNINGSPSESLAQKYDSLTLEYSSDVGEWMIL